MTSRAANGNYQIAGLESGNVTVSASGPGLVPLPSATVAVAAPGTTTDNIALQPGATVSGTITIPGGGSPPAGTTVEALPTDGTLPDGTIDSQDGAIDSNGDGGFSIAGLAPGDYSIVASSPGLGDATLSVTVVGTTPITGQDLALTDAGTVTGVITDAATGLPIAGAIVSSDSLGTTGPVTTGTDGSYSLPDVSVGSVKITVTPPDDTHVAQVVPTTVTAGGPNVVTVALAPAGTLSATIEDGSGNPLDGVQVTVVGPTFTGATGGVQPDVLTTDATGTATDTGLIPGSYDLQVQGSTVDHPFTITAAEPRRVVRRHRPRGDPQRRGGGRGRQSGRAGYPCTSSTAASPSPPPRLPRTAPTSSTRPPTGRSTSWPRRQPSGSSPSPA